MISGCAWLVVGVLVGVIVGHGHLAADIVGVHVGDVGDVVDVVGFN